VTPIWLHGELEGDDLALVGSSRAEIFDADHFINLDDPEGFDAMLETVL
jgi:hypothetical protein